MLRLLCALAAGVAGAAALDMDARAAPAHPAAVVHALMAKPASRF